MKLRGTCRVFAAALLLTALLGRDAGAQSTPTLTVSAVGNSVTIQWTAVPLALGYTLVAGTAPGTSNVAVINLPAIVGTRIVVLAPNGTYYVRVAAFAGPTTGPFSNEASVTAGAPATPCVPGTAPTVTATPDGNDVVVSWTAVPGATSYSIQWSRFSGGAELVESQPAGTTSLRKAVGMNGTFFVRIVAVSACGNTTSAERAFTLAAVKRHLAAAEVISILNQVAQAYPQAWFNAHRDGSPERWDYIILATRRLHQASGGTIGGNWRRAAVGDLSMDGLSVENPADGRYYFADVIGGAGGPNPSIGYDLPFHDGALLRDGSGRYAPHGFANPSTLKTRVNYGAAGGW